MTGTSFHRYVNSWLWRIIRQRILLVERGSSLKNPSLMIENSNYLKRYLEAYQYNTDKRAARFFITNRDRISSLLPGHGSPGHDKAEREFTEIIQQANEILYNYENLSLWANQPGYQSHHRAV